MESISKTLAQYDSMVASTVMNSTSFKHTHPPIRGIDMSCLYCRIHGNVFSNGVKATNSDELCHHVIPITNTRESSLVQS